MKKIINYIFKKLGYKIIKIKPKIVKTEEEIQNGLIKYNTETGVYYLPANSKNDIIANHIKNNKIFEKEVVDIAYTYIKKNSVVLDIGSNFGQMAILFSKKIGNDGLIYAFDADDYIFNILEANIKANGLENKIKPIFGAVHDKINEELYFPKQDFVEFETYGSYGIDYNAKSGRVLNSLTIDSLQIKKTISFMKIDIQGGDLLAMKGAIKTIKKNKMPILFEYEFRFEERFNLKFQEYVDFVNSINYKFEKVVNGHNYLIIPKK